MWQVIMVTRMWELLAKTMEAGETDHMCQVGCQQGLSQDLETGWPKLAIF